MTTRNPQPEILDHLPPDHPDAVASRRDLRFINTLMGNDRWLRTRLMKHLRPGMKIVELGAGDGSFARSLQSHLSRDFSIHFTAIDLAPRPPDWPDDPRFEWRQENIFHSDALADADGVMVCLMLHHFDDRTLSILGARLTNARFFLAREPARQSLWMRFLLYPFRLNPVTKHDMKISIEAGFLGSELADTLGLRQPEWNISTRETPLNAHQFEAVRGGCPVS
ncbi:MAG: hypothetical protein ACKO2G_07860 [Verrucomicrobiales bacterium]